MDISANIIIEKPVSLDLSIFPLLETKDTISYFLDETLFCDLFQKKDIKRVQLSLPSQDGEILEHALGFFLLREDFKYLLEHLSFQESS